MKPIRLILGYDTLAHLSQMVSVLQSESRVSLVGSADTPAKLLDLVSRQRPDAVLLPIAPQVGFGQSFVEVLAKLHTGGHLILLGPNAEAKTVAFLLSLGATGYVCQESSPSVLRKALESAASGYGFIDPAILPASRTTRRLVKLRPIDGTSEPKFLSAREAEVLQLLAQGFTNLEVSKRLSLSVKSAETYRARICRKLGVRSRSDFFRYAIANNMVSSDRSESTIHAPQRLEDSPPRLADSTEDVGASWSMETGEYGLDVTQPSLPGGAKEPSKTVTPTCESDGAAVGRPSDND